MPKFVGRRIPGAVALAEDASTHELVRLSYSQAVKLPPDAVRYQLDTTDRGGPKSYAKRWNRWYATPDAIEGCADSTKRMRHLAVIHRLHHVAVFLRNCAKAGTLEAEHPLRNLGKNLRYAAAGAMVAATLVDHSFGVPRSSYDLEYSVVLDACEQRGVDRTVASAALYWAGRTESHGRAR